jgi:hypothetical protein
MDISNVGKPTLLPVSFIFIRNLMLKRNPIDDSNVGKPSLIPVTF